MKLGDHRAECCKQDANLGPVEEARPGLFYKRCGVCQRRHFNFTVDPLKMGLRAAPMGRKR